jgi:hypothetical protein
MIRDDMSMKDKAFELTVLATPGLKALAAPQVSTI